MAIQITPFALQNSSHSAALFRQQSSAPYMSGGILTTGEMAVTAQSTPNMSVQVAAGRAMVVGNSVSPPAGFAFTTQGMYNVLNDATATVTIAASDATNPRIDVVYVQVQDAFYSGAANQVILGVVAGTPAVSPAIPATPSNALALGTVAVAANATTIVGGNIAGVPMVAFVGTRGIGTMAQRNTLSGVGIWEGLLWGDTTTGIEYRVISGAWVAVSGTYQATGSLGALPTSAVSVATFTLPAGTYKIDGLGTYDWSTSTAPRLYSQLYNSTASALIGSTSSVGPGALIGGAAFAIFSVVTLTVASVIQVRVYQTGGVGTINLSNTTLLATQTTLR